MKMNIFSFPRCRSIQKSTKEECSFEITSFSIETDGSCYKAPVQTEAPV